LPAETHDLLALGAEYNDQFVDHEWLQAVQDVPQDRLARDMDQTFWQDIGMGFEPDAFASHRDDDVHNGKYNDKCETVNIEPSPPSQKLTPQTGVKLTIISLSC